MLVTVLSMPRRQSDQSRDVLPVQQDQAPLAGADVGERISAALERAGKDISWLAKVCGVRWQTAQYWVLGKSYPEGKNIEQIAGALDMDPRELLGVMDGQDPPFDAWRPFLESELGKTMSADERLSMQSIRWPHGRQPTIAAYSMALTLLRTLTEPRAS